MMDLRSLFLALSLGFASLLSAQDVLLHSESFELATTDWTTSGSCPGYPWKITSSNASDGAKSAIFESFYAQTGCTAELLSPTLTVNNAGPDDSIYFYFDIYRSTGSSGANDRAEFHFQNNSGSTVLGPVTIYRHYQKSPVSPSGWAGYVFKCKLSLAGAGSTVPFKFLIKGISNYGDNVLIDNISIYHHKSTPVEKIKLTNPNGGNTLTGGANYNITWFSTSVNKVNIDFTIDGGLNWVNIATNVNATDYTYNWIIPKTSSQTCKVRVTNFDNASDKDESDAYFTINNNVGIDEMDAALGIYPNPAHDYLKISFDQDNPLLITLIDLRGVEVLKQALMMESGTSVLQLPETLSKGVYMLQVQSQQGMLSRKLIIE